MKLIDGEALLKLLDVSMPGCPSWVRELIVSAPTYDRRTQAAWIPSNIHKGYCTCSNCKNCYIEPEWAEGNKWNYCPSCGAKMVKQNEMQYL